MMAFTRAPLCTSLRRVTAQTQEPELIAAARVNACVYTSTFLNRPRSGSPSRLYSVLSCHIKDCQNTVYYLNFLKKNILYSGLAKSLARRPGAIVFSSRATKMYHCPARRATLNTGLPRNVPSKLRALGRTLLQPRPRRRNNIPLARTQKLVGKVI